MDTYLLKKETKPNGDIWYWVEKNGMPISDTWTKSYINKPHIEQQADMNACIKRFEETLFKTKVEVIKQLQINADGVTVLD